MPYKLFTDKTEIFECDIQLKGASLSNAFARVILESDDINLVFNGDISNKGKCTVPIKKLKGVLDEGIDGKILLEVVADDVYFNPWSDSFEVETSKQLTVEVKSQSKEVIKETKPTIKIKGLGKPKKTSSLNHVRNLSKMLVKEGINIKNIKTKQQKLNEVVLKYITKHNVSKKEQRQVIKNVLEVLQKVKK